MISQSDIDKIFDLDAVKVIGDYIKLKKQGKDHWACCPFHTEDSPSFSVNAVKNMWKCFGCGVGGNHVKFVMDYEKLTYPEAVREIAKKNNITITERELTDDEKRIENTRESLQTVNEIAARYFTSHLKGNKKAESYILGRFQQNTINMFGVGYAIDEFHGLHHELMQGGVKEDILLQASLIKENDEGKRYDFFRNRIVFPIHDKYGKVISFNGRTLGDDKPKYINTAETELYNKSKTLYGMHLAFKAIKTLRKAYVVEGNTDVMRLHDIGVDNTVGTCGTSLTDDHAAELKRYSDEVTLIFDGDEAGEKATIKAGKILIKHGLTVSVIRLPVASDTSEKNDPDSYFTTIEIFNSFRKENEKPFITWYALHFQKKHGESPEGRSKLTEEMGTIIATLPNSVIQEAYIHEISKICKLKERYLKSAMDKQLDEKADEPKEEKANNIPDFVLLTDYEKYGFYEDNRSYWFKGKNGPYKGSNFIIKPLFHIESVQNAKRLFEIVNEFGYSRVIELLQKDLVSLSTFRVRVESLGNFVWLAPETDLYRLKSYLYENTQTCSEITQLGWQSRLHFYAWANGIYNGKFTPTNDLGIVNHDEHSYYIPAFSSIYKNEHNLYVAERKFKHMDGKITVHDYVKQLITVYDNNALVGFSFYIATLFRDYIVGKFSFFPILNLFGPKGAGKTHMAKSLLKLFGTVPGGPNINSTSKAALADHISQFSNALCHIDEYKNNLDFEKIEFLKGVWDGVGRTRMNMDKDKKKETTAVDIGLILTGQEMPTADIALFSRLIFLTFTQVEYSNEEKEDLKKLEKMEHDGLTHITEHILSDRDYFKAHFDESYMKVSTDMQTLLAGALIEDRIFKNWCIVIASYHCMEMRLDMPFKYQDTIKIFHALLIQQNSETKKGNEISIFWGIVEYLLKDGLIEEGVDFKFDHVQKIETDKAEMEWKTGKQLIYINHSRIIPLYRKHGYQMKENVLPVKTLEYYLMNDKRYLGRKQSVRFKTNALKDIGQPGESIQRPSYTITKAMVFDYEALDVNMMSYDADNKLF